MPLFEEEMKSVTNVARRIIPQQVKDLFMKYCHEILLFSDQIVVEITPFEVRFLGPGGFRTAVSPYRDLFLVSVGSTFSCDVRVDTRGAYFSALDLALRHFLEAQGKCSLTAE